MSGPHFSLGRIDLRLLLILGTLIVAACFGDGPTGPFPGGPLSGEHIETAEADWQVGFARETVEVQIGLENPHCGGIDHFGFPLIDTNDLDDAIAEVEAAGGRLIEREIIGGGLPTAFVADPDGYRIQL